MNEVTTYVAGLTYVDREYDERAGPAIEPLHFVGFRLRDVVWLDDEDDSHAEWLRLNEPD